MANSFCWKTYYSIGGGFIVDEEHFCGQPEENKVEVPYPYQYAADLRRHCKETGLSLFYSGDAKWTLRSKEEISAAHFAAVWGVMKSGIERGV